jgi:membrane protease YdiL (CAAX protease family)
MIQSEVKPRGDLRRPIVVAAVLVVYSNGLAVLADRLGSSAELTFRYVNPVLLLVLVPLAAKEAGGLKGLGLQRKGLLASTGWGLLVGAGLATISILFFANPVVTDAPLNFGPVANMPGSELWLDLLVRIPISVAFFEELAFRGMLYGMLRQRLSAWKAIGISSLAFGLWHVAVTAISVMNTNLTDANNMPGFLQGFEVPLGVVGGVIATGLAGVAFALVREKTGNLAGSVVAHWVADGLMIGALWWMAHR